MTTFPKSIPIGRILSDLPDREPFRSYRSDFQRYIIIITNMMDCGPRCVSLKAGLWPGQTRYVSASTQLGEAFPRGGSVVGQSYDYQVTGLSFV